MTRLNFLEQKELRESSVFDLAGWLVYKTQYKTALGSQKQTKLRIWASHSSVCFNLQNLFYISLPKTRTIKHHFWLFHNLLPRNYGKMFRPIFFFKQNKKQIADGQPFLGRQLQTKLRFRASQRRVHILTV
jgi:hypothetical protein